MSPEIAIRGIGLGKAYRLYRRPSDRLKELLLRRRDHGEEFWAVQGIDLELRRGEAMAIVGRNGSGKSTLLQLLCGTLQPTRGTLEVRGRIAALLELGAGFNPDFTGRENVYVSASVLGLTTNQITERFAAIEAFAGIGDFIDQPVRHYSSGMYARLAFSVCAHVDADILVIDEILAVGDSAFQQKCMRFLHDFRKRGSLLFVSHSEGAVIDLCERALWLDHGEMRATGPSVAVCRQYLSSLTETTAAQRGFRVGEGVASPRVSTPSALPPVIPDARRQQSNPIDVSGFNPDAPWHGHGGAVIDEAQFFSPDGQALRQIQGGDEIELRIGCHAEQHLHRPIIGFMIRNAAGQNLLSDNTYTTYRINPPSVAAGQHFGAAFRFQLPYLPSGDYSLTVAITEGTQADHYHRQWFEDAVILRVRSSPIPKGLVGIPMSEIRLEMETGAA